MLVALPCLASLRDAVAHHDRCRQVRCNVHKLFVRVAVAAAAAADWRSEVDAADVSPLA